MAQCQVPWGSDALTVSLPDDWDLVQVAAPELPKASAEWPDRLAESLNRPDGTAPLAELARQVGPEGRICIVVEDITRHSPLEQILPIILRELHHARIRDEQIELLFATGMHPPMTAKQVADKIGPLAETLRWRCNEATNPDAHELLGEVAPAPGRPGVPLAVDRAMLDADLRIVVAGTSPHLQAGFGGGEKMFVPGCASLETIARLHNTGLPRHARPLVGEENQVNPMRRIIDAAGRRIAERAPATFAVQYLLDADDQPSDITAGQLARGQRMLAKKCAASAGIIVNQPADVLIVNAAPRDFDLWQSFKCIANTCWAARENGVIVVLARCEGGLNMPAPKFPIGPRWLRRIIRLLGVPGLTGLFNRLLPGANGEAKFFVRLALETLHRTPILIYSPELAKAERAFPGLAVFDDLDATLAEADDLLGEGSRRVICFPLGGASYPVLRRRGKGGPS